MVGALRSDAYNALAFPAKLYAMLKDSEEQGFQDVVCWQQGGKSFKINNAERFSKEVMKVYFSQSKYKSFQRQINIYGFRRIPHGPFKGGYIHPHFTRDAPPHKFDLVVRKPKKVNEHQTKAEMSRPTVRKESNDDGITVQDALFHIRTHSVQFDFDVSDLNVLFDEDSDREDPHDNSTNDLYQRYTASADESHGKASNIFPWKLHLMLDYAREEGLEYIVSWVDDGRAFKVHDSNAFVAQIMPNYFDQTKFESFRRQLNLYGFTRVAKGKNRGVISHPYFQRNARHLCHQIVRKNALPPASSPIVASSSVLPAAQA